MSYFAGLASGNPIFLSQGVQESAATTAAEQETGGLDRSKQWYVCTIPATK